MGFKSVGATGHREGARPGKENPYGTGTTGKIRQGSGYMAALCPLGPCHCLRVARAEFVPPGPSHQHPGRTSPVPQEPIREIGQMNHFLRVPILGLHFKRLRVTLCTPAPKTTRLTPPGKGGHSGRGRTRRRGRNRTPGSPFCPTVPPVGSRDTQSWRAIWSKALGSRRSRTGGGKMGTGFSSSI